MKNTFNKTYYYCIDDIPSRDFRERNNRKYDNRELGKGQAEKQKSCPENEVK
jgi:hypothetical protein